MLRGRSGCQPAGNNLDEPGLLRPAGEATGLVRSESLEPGPASLRGSDEEP